MAFAAIASESKIAYPPPRGRRRSSLAGLIIRKRTAYFRTVFADYWMSATVRERSFAIRLEGDLRPDARERTPPGSATGGKRTLRYPQ